MVPKEEEDVTVTVTVTTAVILTARQPPAYFLQFIRRTRRGGRTRQQFMICRHLIIAEAGNGVSIDDLVASCMSSSDVVTARENCLITVLV